MTLPDLEPEDIERGSMKVLREEEGEERIECWTDGEWVRLGRDIEAGRCIEFKVEKFETVESKLRYTSGAEKFSLKAEYGGDEKYYVLHEWTEVVVKDLEPVLKLGDDGWPLYHAKGMAMEERDDFESEEIARSLAESIRPFMEVTTCEQIGTSNRVRVSLYRENRTRVELRLVDELRDHAGIREDEVAVRVVDDEDEDGIGIRYDFKVNTAAVQDDLESIGE